MKYLLWGLLFFAFAYLVPIAGRPLLRPDEFRYGEIPREMLATGDFVTPRLLGVRYFEKPVLGYWLIAGSFRVFGLNRFALRLPMALATGLTALLIALWIKRATRDPELALWTAVFYLSTGLVWLLGTTAVLDSILCLFTTATLICVHQAVTTEKWGWERLIWLVLAGVTAGLGFMTKGFVAWAAPGCAAVAWLLLTKRWTAFLWLPWIPLVSLAATITPWALEIHRAEPDFWCQFVVVEHLLRLYPKPEFWQRFVDLGNLRNFDPDDKALHPQPFWFFVPVLLGTIFPAAFTVLSGWAAGKEGWKKVWRSDIWKFSLCGFLLPFCFFSASKGKLATYILVCYPFVSAVLVMPALEAVRSGRRGAQLTLRWSFDILGWLLLVGGGALIALGLALLPPVSLGRHVPALADAAPLCLLMGAAAAAGGFRLIRRRRENLGRIAGFFGFFALATAASAAIPDFGSTKMPERHLRILAAADGVDLETAKIFTYGQMAHAVSWTLRRSDIMLMNSAGELDYGIKAAEAEGDRRLLMMWDLDKLIRRPDRPTVLFFSAYDPEDDRRYRLLFKHDPKRIVSGSAILLVFPPPAAKDSAPPKR